MYLQSNWPKNYWKLTGKHFWFFSVKAQTNTTSPANLSSRILRKLQHTCFQFQRLKASLLFLLSENILAVAETFTKPYKVTLIGFKKEAKPSRPDPGQREKIYINSYFHTSLRCLKRCHEGLKVLHKTFWGTTKKCENGNLS